MIRDVRRDFSRVMVPSNFARGVKFYSSEHKAFHAKNCIQHIQGRI